MSASDLLRELEQNHDRTVPIFRKTGTYIEGADAFTRDRPSEKLNDVLPELIAVVEECDRLANCIRGDLGCARECHEDRAFAALLALTEQLLKHG